MPSRSAEEKAERKLLLQQKKEARALQKQAAPKAPPTATTAAATSSKAGLQPNDGVTSATASNEEAFVLMHLPEVALHHIMSFLSAQDLGKRWCCVSRERMAVSFGEHTLFLAFALNTTKQVVGR